LPSVSPSFLSGFFQVPAVDSSQAKPGLRGYYSANRFGTQVELIAWLLRKLSAADEFCLTRLQFCYKITLDSEKPFRFQFAIKHKINQYITDEESNFQVT